MKIVVVGANHKTAPVEVREKLSFAKDALTEAVTKLSEYVRHGAIVSTCNRIEIYAIVDRRTVGAQNLLRFLSDYSGLSIEALSPWLYTYEQQEAVNHLFRVAAGLDSMVLGEAEILGQVREAMEIAQDKETMGPFLASLFRRAIRVGRDARTKTAISRSTVSVSSTSVQLARQIFGELGTCSVLVVGTGDVGRSTAKCLLDCGAGQVSVANRTFERAVELAQNLGGQAVPFEKLPRILATTDIIISCTGAPSHILGTEEIGEAMRGRWNRPLFLIDIAVPRDIDPGVRGIRNVFLYDIDDLQAVSEANLAEREKEVAKVEAIVEDEVGKFMKWWGTLEAVPTIKALRVWAESVRQKELAKTMSKLNHLPEEDRAKIAVLTEAIVNKMVHFPISYLKEQMDGNHVKVVRELFSLDEMSY